MAVEKKDDLLRKNFVLGYSVLLAHSRLVSVAGRGPGALFSHFYQRNGKKLANGSSPGAVTPFQCDWQG